MPDDHDEALELCQNLLQALTLFKLTEGPALADNEAADTVRLKTQTYSINLLRGILAQRKLLNPVNYVRLEVAQVELAMQIIQCEKQIQIHRNTTQARFDAWNERRILLKFLGSTVAWILLRESHEYVTAMAGAPDRFMFGQRGTVGEIAALIDFYNHGTPAILHGITHCLRIGDLTQITSGGLKVIEAKYSINQIQRQRQTVEGQLSKLRSFQDLFRGRTVSGIMEYPTQLTIIESSESRNWQSLSGVARIARDRNWSVAFPEPGVSIGVYRTRPNLHSCMNQTISEWSRTPMWFGVMTRQVDELNEIMPFTLYKIPFWLKRELLLGKMNVVTCVNEHVLASSLQKLGFGFGYRNTNDGSYLNLSLGDEQQDATGIIRRVLYEGLTLRSLISFMKKVTAHGDITETASEPSKLKVGTALVRVKRSS